MAEKNPKTLTYTQEQNGSPFFFYDWTMLMAVTAKKDC